MRRAERLDDPGLAAAARETRAKLQATLPDPGTRKLADAPFFALRRSTGAPAHAALLRQAIRKRRIVALSYADAAGRATTRRLSPLAIFSLPEGWMVSGWCDLRCGFRTFRLDRITALCLTEDPQNRDPAKNLAAFLAQDACERT